MNNKTFALVLICVFINAALLGQSAQGGTGVLVVNSDLMKSGQLNASQLGFLSNRLKSSSIHSNRYNGTVYLFNDWSHSAEMVIKGQKYHIDKVNYNIQEDRFLAKVDSDSTLVFNFGIIDEIIIDDRSFVNLYSPKEKKYNAFEIVFRNKNFSVLKSYSISVTEPKQAPGGGIAKPKLSKRSSYFYYQQGNFSSIKLNKKTILKLVPESNKSKLIDYVKNNKLSYRKEIDLTKMLKFIFKN